MIVAALALAGGVAVPAMAETTTGTITGHLTDNGSPVSASVQLIAADFTHFDFASTDSTGGFTFTDVPPNDYRISFNLPGGVQQHWPQQIDLQQAGLITVTEGATITIEEPVAPHGSFTGHVTNADGSPAADLQVRASATAGVRRRRPTRPAHTSSRMPGPTPTRSRSAASARHSSTPTRRRASRRPTRLS